MTDIIPNKKLPTYWEDRFKKAYIRILEYILDIATQLFNSGNLDLDPNLIKLYISEVRDEKNKGKDMLNTFIKLSSSYWSVIYERNEKFLVSDKNPLFNTSNIGDESKAIIGEVILAFKHALTGRDRSGNPLLADDIKNDIWDGMCGLVIIGINYIHITRVPSLKGDAPHYSIESYKDVKLKAYARMYAIELTFK